MDLTNYSVTVAEKLAIVVATVMKHSSLPLNFFSAGAIVSLNYSVSIYSTLSGNYAVAAAASIPFRYSHSAHNSLNYLTSNAVSYLPSSCLPSVVGVGFVHVKYWTH